MEEEQKELWGKIQAFALDDPRAEMNFTDRLARENGWRLRYALRAVEEYRRFMLLLCLSPHPLTPSDQVDQVWHLHLLYTRSYWIDFCQDTLGRSIHHGPTAGGLEERQKFTNWYEQTKELYASVFGQAPPPDIWPDSRTRFGEVNFRRVNLARHWVFPKISFF